MDYAWEVYANDDGKTQAHGNVILFTRRANWDPTAVYTVDYIPLEPYKVTAPTNAVTVEYADNIGSAIQLLTKKAAGLETRMSNAEQKQNFRFGKDEGGVYIIIDEEALT